jgi:RND family efflux transporter MFP subunit
MKTRIAAIAVLVIVGIGAIAFVLAPRSSSGSTSYLTATVERGDVTADVAATGTISPTEQYGLAFGTPARLIDDEAAPNSETTWPVAEVSVTVGDRVTKDQVLATADTADLEAELELATLDRRAANNQLLSARDALEDAEDSGTTAQIRQARISYYNAQAGHKRAVSAERDLKADIAEAVIRSPIDGVVTSVDVVAGSDAPSGDAIVVAAPTMQVETDVVESDISAISVGQDATVTIDALGEDVTGTVASIGLAADDASQSGIVSFPVTISIADVPAALRAGMTADVTIVTASVSDVLSIPTAALNGGLGAYTVGVLGADGVPVDRVVQVGLVTGGRTEITDGLAEGEVVVTGTLTEPQGFFGTDGGGFGGPGGGGQRPVVVQSGPGAGND